MIIRFSPNEVGDWDYRLSGNLQRFDGVTGKFSATAIENPALGFIRTANVHHFANTGDAEAKGIGVITPAAIGPAFFREAAAVVEAAAGGPPDPASMIEVLRRHGLTPAPPQGAAREPIPAR